MKFLIKENNKIIGLTMMGWVSIIVVFICIFRFIYIYYPLNIYWLE